MSHKVITERGIYYYKSAEEMILHRTDGPAAIQNAGVYEYHQNGKLHRLDGPAIEWADGCCMWAVDGIVLCHKFNIGVKRALKQIG